MKTRREFLKDSVKVLGCFGGLLIAPSAVLSCPQKEPTATPVLSIDPAVEPPSHIHYESNPGGQTWIKNYWDVEATNSDNFEIKWVERPTP